MSGWVKVTMKAGNQVITVGNESAPGLNHHACIKDFEFGHANGCECRLTIHDEQGSSFVSFMENILKNMEDADTIKATTMVVQYGWVTTNCDTGSTLNVRSSQEFYFMMRDVQCNFSGGKFMFVITGNDIMEVSYEGKMDKIYGGDDDSNKVHLTEALTKLFTDPDAKPVVKSVRFLKRGKCGAQPTEVEFERFDDDPKKGPKGKWECKNRSKIDIAKDWLKDFVTKDKKALIPAYNSEVDGGEMIFWEDPKPGCGEVVDWENYSFGKYIVNGGPQSSVLEFNPKIKWNFSVLTNTGGGVGENQPLANLDGGKNPGLPGCETVQRKGQPTAGSQTGAAAGENVRNIEGADANKKAAENRAINRHASFQNYYAPIEAELVVLGDEKITKPSLCLFGNVHIVFIDPYYIFEQGGNNCGDWLSQPACNPVLSNKAWLVKNITHRIQDGRFTTTLGVFLGAPGLDFDTGQPLGGPGSCGWMPPKN